LAPSHKFTGKSVNSPELNSNPALELDYVIAIPRMARYVEVSSKIYGIYLKFVAPEDIHVYSIDEVFIDATSYMRLNKLTGREFAMKLIREVLRETGITATAGVGTNLYLSKIAMDIVAKHIPADNDGVRIAELDEQTYRNELWYHQPITDFWRVGKGYANKLASIGICTMGDVARMSVKNEDVLYRMFGINAELLIDHAWGWEPCTIAAIKSYKPENSSISSGQVLQEPYDYGKACVVVMEMADQLALDLVEKRIVTDQLVLNIGYDMINLADTQRRQTYAGPMTTDYYGRKSPKDAHGSINLERHTASGKIIIEAMMNLFKRIANPDLMIRRITVVANHIIDENSEEVKSSASQLDLFTDYEAVAENEAQEQTELEKEKRLQDVILYIKKKFGKNALLKGMNLLDGATGKARNEQIGGHKK
jgi:DNA polymerase V